MYVAHQRTAAQPLIHSSFSIIVSIIVRVPPTSLSSSSEKNEPLQKEEFLTTVKNLAKLLKDEDRLLAPSCAVLRRLAPSCAVFQ